VRGRAAHEGEVNDGGIADVKYEAETQAIEMTTNTRRTIGSRDDDDDKDR
jgi:hypothetical protein